MKTGLRLPDASMLRAQPGGVSGEWQCHHLLPRGLSRHRQIAAWLAMIDKAGPPMAVRPSNILWLPATEAAAAASGMALHRGPHPAYNEVVAARLERIRASGLQTAEARARISRLQRVLTAALSGAAPVALRLNRHDPMRLFAEYASLDDAIARLLVNQPG